MMVQTGWTTVPSLRPWTLPRPRRQHHPIFAGVEGMLHTAFPLVSDEPETRLEKALAAFLAALTAH
jgi:hypothetical protein